MIIDLSNKKFGRWSVISRQGDYWNCKCECGTTRLVVSQSLRDGRSKSCGCLVKENFIKRNTKHGKSRTYIYKKWLRMVSRCENKNDPVYKYYGGRGIVVCERWKNFSNFYADMGEKPRGKTLDRIDNNGPYSPENCRWANVYEQANNKRTNIRITFNKKSMTLSQWCRELKLDYKKIYPRIRYGWSLKEAIQRYQTQKW